MKARLPVSALSRHERIKHETKELVERSYDEQLKKFVRDQAKKELLMMDSDFGSEFDAMILYVLHEDFGFGKDRLNRFMEKYEQLRTKLRDTYDLEEKDGDFGWFCKRELKKIGITVERD